MFHVSASSSNRTSGTGHRSSQSPQQRQSTRTLAKHQATDLYDAIDQIEPESLPPLPLHYHPIQAKLMVGRDQDRFEQEADHLAESFVQSHHPQNPHPISPFDLEKQAPGKPHITPVQLSQDRWNKPTAASPQSADRSHVSHLLKHEYGMGRPLPDHWRSPLEQYFQTPLGHIRLHTGLSAQRLNQTFQSRAFTTQNHIFVGSGGVSMAHGEGQRLLTHEVAHTLQQQTMMSPAYIQCTRLKGRGKGEELIEIETDEITSVSIPDLVRLNLEEVQVILNHAEAGNIWNPETQAFEPANWTTQEQKKMRQKVRKKLAILQPYFHQQEVPKPKLLVSSEVSPPSESTLTPMLSAPSPFESDEPKPKSTLQASWSQSSSVAAQSSGGAPSKPQDTPPSSSDAVTTIQSARDYETNPYLTALKRPDFYVPLFQSRYLQFEEFIQALKSQGPHQIPKKEFARKIQAIKSADYAEDLLPPEQPIPPLAELEDMTQKLSQLSQSIYSHFAQVTHSYFERLPSGQVISLPPFERLERLKLFQGPYRIMQRLAQVEQLELVLNEEYLRLMWRQRVERALPLIEKTWHKIVEAQKLMQQKKEEKQRTQQVSDRMVNSYGAALKLEKKPGQRTSGANISQRRDFKNVFLDMARSSSRSLSVMEYCMESDKESNKLVLEVLIKVKQVLSETENAMTNYTKVLAETKELFGNLQIVDQELEHFYQWMKGHLESQQYLAQLENYQFHTQRLETELQEQLETRQRNRIGSVKQLTPLRPTLKKARELSLETQAPLDELAAMLEHVHLGLTQERVEFETKLDTWFHFDPDNIRDEIERITAVVDTAKQHDGSYLADAIQLRSQLHQILKGTKEIRMMTVDQSIYIDPEDWQAIQHRTQQIQMEHHKSLGLEQKSLASKEVPSSQSQETKAKPYSRTDSSTWVPTPGGIVFLNGLTRDEVVQADPETVPALLSELEQLELYGEHHLKPAVGSIYHRHILRGAGGIGFIYQLNPKTMTVTPCVIDIATERPSRGTGNMYAWKKTRVIGYDPPLA